MTENNRRNEEDEEAEALPAWATRYDPDDREIVANLGINDRGSPIFVAFNLEMIAMAHFCQGKPIQLFEEMRRRITKDWSPILMRHGVLDRALRTDAAEADSGAE